ncbi:MAG: hypothetical protein H6865_04470 [Rhodospirillales bacterium]|nr:hypothetical protein [Alphaproteobacteria bacterium]MCB9986873.1 hypothetical protein [Rhodospirillales bacterium]USO08581.1 MAG: hypothetical protein H6866_03820 [Rhodospirillales bacterium]
MQFLVIARDGGDADALKRRLAVREQHIALSNEAIKRGEQLLGAAMLNEDGAMKGSVMIVDFPDRATLDAWLRVEPYVTGKVWQDIEIIPCRIGPSFESLFAKN